jgi:hypothetical protein
MVKLQQGIHSFFKRKRGELNNENEVVEEEQTADRVPLIQLIKPENHRQEQEQHVVFRDIEFLERDPALHPQIWDYPSNQQNEVQRAYLKLGPMQPKLKNYKASGPQGHQHHFQHHWFSEFPCWLEYSESNGCAYYLFCFVSSKNIKKRGGYDAFTIQGFNNWKKVHDGENCAFLVHVGSDPSSEHNNSIKESHDLLNNPIHIDNVMERRKNTEKERNRLRLRTSIAANKWLSFQSCAFRGHDEIPVKK